MPRTKTLSRFMACHAPLQRFVATICHFTGELKFESQSGAEAKRPIHAIQIAAAASFILFGLWTIRGDELAGEDKRFHFSPFWTVAIAFFIAEMGDKTQLATVALAAKYQSVLPVLVGTTAGMLIADAIGIGIGIVMGEKSPRGPSSGLRRLSSSASGSGASTSTCRRMFSPLP